MRRLKAPKCPKCDMSYSLSLTDKQAHCGGCQHTWKPAASAREKIVTQLAYDAEMRQAKAFRIEREKQAAEARAAAAAKRWRRDDRGWVVRDDELDLTTLTGFELMQHRDRLTEHLDGLVEHGFVDGTLSEARHDDCYELLDDGHKIAACSLDCPVVIAQQQTYLASAYRDHLGQLSLFSP